MVSPSNGTSGALRAAVIGTGGIAQEHFRFLDRSDRVELVGLCDLSPVAVSYHSEAHHTRGFSSVEELLADTRPDVVHVLTPPNTHVAITRQCLDAGAHVICEKPITLNEADLVELLEAADTAGRRVTENHNYRFNPEIVGLDDMVASGVLGTVGEVEVRIGLPVNDPDGRFGDPNLPSPIHRLPAGVIHDFITHFSYLVDHFTPGVEWSRVDSQWSNHAAVPHVTVDDLDAILVGDGPAGAVHARIRFSAALGPDCFEVTVRGTDGYGQVEMFSGRVTKVVPRKVGQQLTSIANMMIGGVELFVGGPRSFKRKIMQEGPYVGLNRFLDLTYASLASGAELPVTAEDMLRTSRLIDRLVAGRSGGRP